MMIALAYVIRWLSLKKSRNLFGAPDAVLLGGPKWLIPWNHSSALTLLSSTP
jgi:hypothetical protein